jgi:uncharacterized protein (TIGR03437 family)
MVRTLAVAGALALVAIGAQAATFGTVIPVRGHVADIAIDTQRNRLYAANFTANHVEVLSLDNQTLLTPINIPGHPTAVAVSPDQRYLVVGQYYVAPASVTIQDLVQNKQQFVSLGSGDTVLAVAFGNSPKALVATTSGVFLLDPTSGASTPLVLTDLSTKPIPVPWATYPAAVITGTAGVSADGNALILLIDTGASSTVVEYRVDSGALFGASITSSPTLGPRSVSVDQGGGTFLAGWTLDQLTRQNVYQIAQFPYPSGVLNQGGHAFDPVRNLFFAQVASAATQSGTSNGTSASAGSASPLLQAFDSDNLTVRESYNLQENLAGRAIFNGNSIYAISDSGITILPVENMASVHRLTATVEDMLFNTSGCSQGRISQDLNLVDPSGNQTDFTLSSSSPGVTFSVSSGTTPATVKVLVDPTAFQDQKGTAAVTIRIASSSAVNIPNSVRVLINTRNPDQKGVIYDVPGAIVDVVADPARDRFYVLRQDQNQVWVFDGSGMNPIALLRTGNTPVQMAIYHDPNGVISDRLLVANDNSQLLNSYDLDTLTAASPIYLPNGYSARSIAAANGSVLATTRSAVGSPKIAAVDMTTGIVSVDDSLTDLYTNTIDINSALTVSPSGQTMLLVMPSGVVAIYDTSARRFVASRNDVSGLSGGYAALSDDSYIVGNNLFNTALVPVGQLSMAGNVSSAITVVDGKGLLSATTAASRNGLLERFALDTFSPVSTAGTSEAPELMAVLSKTVPLGQTGQTLLPFTRGLAPLSNGQWMIQLSTSGFTAFPWQFDAPVSVPVIKAVTNAADQTSSIAPGGLISIWGSALSTATMAAQSLPLTSLNNVCLYAGGVPVPLLFASSGQINAQLPFNTPSGASLVLSTENGASAPFHLAAQPTAPAIFRANDGTPLIIRTVDNKMITDSTPIHLNEILNIYVTGLGPVSPGIASGVGAPSSPLAVTANAPAVYIGGSQLFTLWAGLVPGLVGVYQINVQVPFHNVPTGSDIPFTVVQGNAQTMVKLSVQQ